MDKKVFIIGNGFDLSLGWLTRYSDYASNREFWPFANEQNSGLAQHLYAKAKLEKWLDIEHELFLYASTENNVRKRQVGFLDALHIVSAEDRTTVYLVL